MKKTKRPDDTVLYELWTRTGKGTKIYTQKLCESIQEAINLEQTYLKGDKVVNVLSVIKKDKDVKIKITNETEEEVDAFGGTYDNY